ncbi:auxin response factor 9-like protein [Tanacetum coccineum]
MDSTTSLYKDVDILIFNTGHWKKYYQEGNHIYRRLKVLDAYTRALSTWAKWVDNNIDSRKTQVIFMGYAISHFRDALIIYSLYTGDGSGIQEESVTKKLNQSSIQPKYMLKNFPRDGHVVYVERIEAITLGRVVYVERTEAMTPGPFKHTLPTSKKPKLQDPQMIEIFILLMDSVEYRVLFFDIIRVSFVIGLEHMGNLHGRNAATWFQYSMIQPPAEKETDEVYAQINLLPESHQSEMDPTSPDECLAEPPRPNVQSFCKVLTGSNISNHGGFLVLRKHANDCLPHLDMTQPTTTQELVAKDLHEFEWRFKHIFRDDYCHLSQPRRHLLTIGWSNFVTCERLVVGDSFIFLSGSEMLLQEAFEIGVLKQYSNACLGIAKQAFHLKCLPLVACRS